MSYCRFTESSDVYAYECEGGVQFWVAGKTDEGLDRLCDTFSEAYRYAKELRDKHGLNVPDTAIESLRADATEEVRRINGAIEELMAENAKLRDALEDYEHRMDSLVDSLTGGLLSKSAGTPNEVIEDAVRERMTTDLVTENAKLRELGLRGEDAKLREERDMYRDIVEYMVHPDIAAQLEAENTKLREELEQWHRLTAGIELPEYPVTEFQPKDLERENAKLRELLSTALGQVKEMCESNKDRCATCPLHHGDDECRMVMAWGDARDLGVEVK